VPPPHAGANMNQQQHIIDIHKLQFRWRENVPLVLDIDSLQIAPGERIFIQGPSGSGKSTLLSLIAGVLTPQRGRLSILGSPLPDLRGAARDTFRADHIGFIFQMFNLLPYLSVLENVTLPLYFSDRRRRRVDSAEQEAIRLLSHLDMAAPEILSRPVTELSVGQQQRVAAARALIGSPELLIADEPTSALDADRRDAFIQLLIDECDAAGTTLVFVSHDAALQSRFDRSIALHEINRANMEDEACLS
jgi:putative ABC transport system ATP-binding protein